MKARGFTLTEVLIGLALSLFMVIAVFEFFGIARDLFGKLKGEEKASFFRSIMVSLPIAASNIFLSSLLVKGIRRPVANMPPLLRR